MSEMVERIARVINPDAWAQQIMYVSASSAETVSTEGRLDHLKEAAREKARAVIAAMREPTFAMAIAPVPWPDAKSYYLHVESYKIMIDAALKDSLLVEVPEDSL